MRVARICCTAPPALSCVSSLLLAFCFSVSPRFRLQARGGVMRVPFARACPSFLPPPVPPASCRLLALGDAGRLPVVVSSCPSPASLFPSCGCCRCRALVGVLVVAAAVPCALPSASPFFVPCRCCCLRALTSAAACAVAVRTSEVSSASLPRSAVCCCWPALFSACSAAVACGRALSVVGLASLLPFACSWHCALPRHACPCRCVPLVLAG